MGVISLEEASRTDIASAGGKGANLGELIQSGFPVPPGFIVCAEVYEAFMGNLNIPKRSNDAYGSAEYRDQVQSQILENKIPAGILDEISSHHSATLKKVPLKQSATELQYAVRSSATAEDLGDASFAGQHDTYYYVTELQLHEMIKKCWASLWSDAAFSYRVSQGIDHHSVNMAVIVQVMIQSEISGVTFTADPVSGDQNLIVTESSWGMGAAIVDGRVSPDQYIVRKDTEVVQSKRIADKKFMVPASIADTDSRLSPVPASLRLSETLSASRLDTLTHWAKKSEAYFGSQQDIEWAFTADEFFILQSRPVTVMGQKEDEIPRGEFVLFKPLAENFTDPLLPLSQDLFVKLFPMMVIIQGRVYTRLSHVRPLFPFKMTNEQIAQLAYLSSSSEVKPILSIIGLLRLATILLVAHLILGVLFRRTSNLPVDFMDSFRHSFKKVVDDDRVDAYGALESLFFKSRFF